MHQQIVGHRAAVDAQFGDLAAQVGFHGLQYVQRLVGDTVERSARDVGRRGPARHAEQRAAGARIPVRCAESGEGRHQIDAVAMRHRACQLLDFRGALDDAEPVAQPLHDRAADENAAFERVVDLIADLPRDRGDEIVLRFNRFVARVHHQEATCAVGVLDHAWLGAHLAEQRRVLVAGDTGQWHGGGEQGGFGGAVDGGRRMDFRQHAARDIHHGQQLVVPFQRMDVEQHGARGVGDIGDVQSLLREIPDQPAVDSAEGELALVGAFARPWHIVEYPADLGCREIRIDRQTGFFPHDGFEATAFQFIAEIGRAAVLPDDGVVHRAARLAVPHDGRFALVGDADGGDRCAIQSRVRDGFGGDAGLRRPDILRVMFDPTWLRIYLREFLLRYRDDVAGPIKQYCA